ncbi:hypothetical protein BJ170DRAFT_592858 [Xylariales sp. AK1849]|nr:hypothetical protein BJ170DRAFT_592858 [Xylariales sp. AK1849]
MAHILGFLILVGFVWVEGCVSRASLLPASVFVPKYTKSLFLYLFVAYSSLGIFPFDASSCIKTILPVESFTASVLSSPLAVGGSCLVVCGGLTLHRLPVTIQLLFSAWGFTISSPLLAVPPSDQFYWIWMLPIMICATIGVGVLYNASSIFITANIPKHQQGIAGACVNGLVFLGTTFLLGCAETAVGELDALRS